MEFYYALTFFLFLTQNRFPYRAQKSGSSSIQETAIREVFEETGLERTDFILGPVVWHGAFDLILGGVPTHIDQTFLVGHTQQKSITLEHLTQGEKKIVKDPAWFSLDALKNSDEVIYPVVLPEYLPDVLEGTYPNTVLELDLGKRPDKKIPKA